MKSVIFFCVIFFYIFISIEGYPEIIKEIGIGGKFTDNLNASVETKMKMAPLKEATTLGNIGLGYKQNYFKKNTFYGIYRLTVFYHRDADYLRMRNHSVFLQFNNNLSKITTLNISLLSDYFDYWREPLYSYLKIKADFFWKQYLSDRFVTEFNYNFINIDFRNIEFKNRIDRLNNSYALIDNIAHVFKSKLKYWLTDSFRTSIQNFTSFVIYEKTASSALKSLSDLSNDKKRNDLFNAVRTDIAYLPAHFLLLSTGYLFEYNSSNAEYFQYFSNNLVFDVMWLINDNQQILAESKWGIYDYFDRQFDERYSNTREDFRNYVSVSYSLKMIDNIKLYVKYNFISNDSNDSIDFDRLTSKTYSTFNKNNIETSLKLTF